MNSNMSNDRDILVDMLTIMYNDNIQTLHSLTTTINNINNSNNQIRLMLSELLTNNSRQDRQYSRQDRQYSRQNRQHSRQNRQRDRDHERERNYTRFILNDTTYDVIDSITEFTIPIQPQRSLLDSAMRDVLNYVIQMQLEQPIELFPTQTQIENATRRTRYCDITRPTNTQCPIALEDFNDNDMVIVIRPCGHIFYPDHLLNWFRNHCRCPVCRYDIRNYNVNTYSNTITDEQQHISRINSVGINNNTDNNNNNDNDTNNNDNNLLDSSGNNIQPLNIGLISELVSLLRRNNGR